eukprot:754235-Rhodomonas_salina.1
MSNAPSPPSIPQPDHDAPLMDDAYFFNVLYSPQLQGMSLRQSLLPYLICTGDVRCIGSDDMCTADGVQVWTRDYVRAAMYYRERRVSQAARQTAYSLNLDPMVGFHSSAPEFPFANALCSWQLEEPVSADAPSCHRLPLLRLNCCPRRRTVPHGFKIWIRIVLRGLSLCLCKPPAPLRHRRRCQHDHFPLPPDATCQHRVEAASLDRMCQRLVEAAMGKVEVGPCFAWCRACWCWWWFRQSSLRRRQRRHQPCAQREPTSSGAMPRRRRAGARGCQGLAPQPASGARPNTANGGAGLGQYDSRLAFAPSGCHRLGKPSPACVWSRQDSLLGLRGTAVVRCVYGGSGCWFRLGKVDGISSRCFLSCGGCVLFALRLPLPRTSAVADACSAS